MDEEQLRQSLISEVQHDEELNPLERRRRDLLDEARDIRRRFADTTDSEERGRLESRYRAIDFELDDLKKAGVTSARRREKPKALRDYEERLERIEKGRKRAVEKTKAGFNAAAFGRIKTELDYLLKNYTPANDGKIETLIDKWRRSGDPAYDPSIRLKLRNVRKKKSKSDYAL